MKFKDQVFNGKTVAEIFAQRGEKVEASQMVTGEVYFLEHKSYEWDVLHRHNEIIENRMYDTICLFDDGGKFMGGYFLCSDMGNIFKATLDQIELLNTYCDK